MRTSMEWKTVFLIGLKLWNWQQNVSNTVDKQTKRKISNHLCNGSIRYYRNNLNQNEGFFVWTENMHSLNDEVVTP